MFGKNSIRPPEKGDGSTLLVQEIFPTVQGEGPHTGESSVFVRLGGCNLACDFCDTEFESFSEIAIDEIVDCVEDFAEDGRKLVVITGGEPLRQNIIALCELLLEEGFAPQIETNGTLWRDLPAGVEVICSPKATNGQYHALRPDIIPRITAVKFIISKSHEPYTAVPEIAAGLPIWLQPMDEYDEHKNKANLDYAMELAEAGGYKVSIQTHKIAGID
ncbi:MAG: 7-carboxy-7-deazaguanine synthase QueE [Rickettsiales bacterium]|nr:7-carboxy-7-deazaguanine synthase QueE [Rickettsiales bacterium]